MFVFDRLALHPTPDTPPSATSDNSNASSSRNWALGGSAYGVCWLLWIVGVVILYEVVYCWWRRWRCSAYLSLLSRVLSCPSQQTFYRFPLGSKFIVILVYMRYFFDEFYFMLPPPFYFISPPACFSYILVLLSLPIS